MTRFHLARATGIAAVLLLAAGPAMAQSATGSAMRPHHANYDANTKVDAIGRETPPPAMRSDAERVYHRPHHADY